VLPAAAPVTEACSRVLIVDDNPLVLRAVARLLRHLGHEPIGAESVAAAREQLRADAFDVVITDLHLGDGSGIDVIRSVADLASGPAPTIVLLSGESRAAHLPDAVTVHYVSKGVESSSFISILRLLCASDRRDR
jgi:two-component system, NtrC family, response regulator PilR